jgi:signal transduction histidine kinase
MKIGTPITTFQQRYILPFLGVLMVAISIFVWITLQQQANLLDKELEKKGKSVVEDLAEISNINILLEDMESLAGNLSQIVVSDEDITNAAIFSTDGALLLSNNEESFTIPPQVNLKQYRGFNLDTEWLFVTPIFDRTDNQLGTAAIRLSRIRVLSMLQESATKLILTTILITFIITGVVYWLLTRIRSMADQEIKRAKEIETAYKKLQNLQSVLRKANESLEEKVKNRTKALQKTNLELQQVNTELKDFAYIVSHDLKAPLRAISSLTEWIIEDYEESFDEDGKEQLSLLKSRVTRMYQLLEGILRYSRIGRGQEEKEVLDLNELVSEVISALLPVEGFKISIIGDLPPIFADKTKIYQVFQNIISNAIKYNDKPIGEVKIWCETNEENGLHYFTIEDNGKGIPEEDFERVFKIFQTLEADKNSAENTGVGLTLVQKIIKKYGGKIFVSSKVGESTAFTFSLPPVAED